MAAFNAVGEMAKRGVGLTLLSHHCELEGPARYPSALLFDSMGLWVVGSKAPREVARKTFVLAVGSSAHLNN